MFFKEVIKLLTITYTVNDYGDRIEVISKKDVFADKRGIRQSEFYQAMATGLKPELVFIIRNIDYNNETKIEYKDKQYDVIRIYDKDGELLELVCEGIIGSEVR